MNELRKEVINLSVSLIFVLTCTIILYVITWIIVHIAFSIPNILLFLIVSAVIFFFAILVIWILLDLMIVRPIMKSLNETS